MRTDYLLAMPSVWSGPLACSICSACSIPTYNVSRAKVGALVATLGTDRMKQIADALRFALGS